MSFVGKWFGYGKDPAFDEGVREYELRHFHAALDQFRNAISTANELAVRDRAKSYVAGCLGKLAHESFQQRDFEAARNLLIEAVGLRPGFADLWLSLARTQLVLGDIDDAAGSVDKALAINSEYAAAQVLAGTVAFRKGDHQGAMESVAQAVANDSRLDGQAWKDAQAAFSKGDTDETYAQLKEIRPGTSDVNDLVAEGDHAAREGQWNRAEVTYRHALEIAPDYADVVCRHGQALMELGQLDQAGQSFDRATEINPDYAEAHALKGIIERRQGNEDAAIAAFKRALDIDPRHPIASQEILHRRI